METINQPKLDEVIGADTKADQITTDQPSQTDGDVLVETAEIEAVVENPVKTEAKPSLAEQLKARLQQRQEQRIAVIEDMPDKTSQDVAQSVEKIVNENVARLNRSVEKINKLNPEIDELKALRPELEKEVKSQVVPELKKEAENDLKKINDEIAKLENILTTQKSKALKAIKTLGQVGKDELSGGIGISEKAKNWVDEQGEQARIAIENLRAKLNNFGDAILSVQGKLSEIGININELTFLVAAQTSTIEDARDAATTRDFAEVDRIITKTTDMLDGTFSNRQGKRVGGAIQSLRFLTAKVDWLTNRQNKVEPHGFEDQRRQKVRGLLIKAAQEFAASRFRADFTARTGCDLFTGQINEFLRDLKSDQGRFKGSKSTLRQRGGGTRSRR